MSAMGALPTLRAASGSGRKRIVGFEVAKHEKRTLAHQPA
jgi:hypothetical protein